MTLTLTDPGHLLVPAASSAEGELIESLRSECGFLLQSIDWATRKLGYDLIGAIFDPISGDFAAVDAMRQDWQSVSAALASTGRNYDAMAAEVPAVWAGRAAEAARERVARMGEAHAVQAEAASLMAQQLANMLAAVREACKVAAGVLAFIEELVLSMSVLKWAKEVVSGGAGIRRAVILIDRAITLVKGLGDVIPPMLKAAALLASLFRVVNLVFLMPASAAEHHQAASHVDDTAARGFDPAAFPGGAR